MADTLTPEQQGYLQDLRQGTLNPLILTIRDELSDNASEDFNNFDLFLKQNGHPNPTPADRSLTVSRQALLRMLFYADDRDRKCLILQCCFGFTSILIQENGLKAVGQVVLIQKGNFHQLEGKPDEDLYFKDSVYRNNLGKLEPFLNMNIDQPLLIDQARQFVDNFIKIYPADRTLGNNPFMHGFLLPVKALINLLTDPNHPFGRANELTLQWGLTQFNIIDGTLGNFTLIIGLGDLRTDPVIEFRTEDISPADESDCPPRGGCA